jgi:hypothetical protein
MLAEFTFTYKSGETTIAKGISVNDYLERMVSGEVNHEIAIKFKADAHMLMELNFEQLNIDGVDVYPYNLLDRLWTETGFARAHAEYKVMKKGAAIKKLFWLAVILIACYGIISIMY